MLANVAIVIIHLGKGQIEMKQWCSKHSVVFSSLCTFCELEDEVKPFDETRTQWFCCETEPPVHNGTYEIRFKAGWFGTQDVKKINYDANCGSLAWDGYSGWMGALEWRGLAVKP